MQCSTQHLHGPVYILRLHPEGGFGSPYTFVATVLVYNKTAHLCGAMGSIDLKGRRLIGRAVKDLGVTSAHWERRHKLAREVTTCRT